MKTRYKMEHSVNLKVTCQVGALGVQSLGMYNKTLARKCPTSELFTQRYFKTNSIDTF